MKGESGRDREPFEKISDLKRKIKELEESELDDGARKRP